MNHDKYINEAADCLLQIRPDPVPRYRILRDILRRPDGDPELDDAKTAALGSRWVNELTEEQNRDGGWGRFHSMNSKARRRVATTEGGVARAVQIGLNPGDKILERATKYLAGLLRGKIPWPEHSEPNDQWPAGQEMFVAATLAEIQPDHELLEPVCQKWIAIAEQTFSSGRYDAERECRAHCELRGATTMRNSYLVLNNRYATFLLACHEHQLSDRTEKALVEWIWKDCGKLGYLNAPLAKPVERLCPTVTHRWFRSQMIMSRFRSWPSKNWETIRRLWDMQNAEGLWDFGATPGLRLSEDWRKVMNRAIDHSVFVLLLLRAHYDANQKDSPNQCIQRTSHSHRR